MELKSCPHCASTRIEPGTCGENDQCGECQDCGLHLHDWNSRPVEDELRARIDALAEAGDEITKALKAAWGYTTVRQRESVAAWQKAKDGE